jgi:hypothetical protein
LLWFSLITATCFGPHLGTIFFFPVAIGPWPPP